MNHSVLYPSEILPNFGGKVTGGSTILDGIDYQFRSVWDSEEQIEKFRDTYYDRISKSGQDYIHGTLTFFFSFNS